MSGHEPTCGFCQSPIETAGDVRRCSACSAVYHDECWQENGGCAVYGCTEGPEIEARKPIEVPVSYWGQENKPCPSCGREILAAAMRCRHCGATFASANPEEASTYVGRTLAEARLPAVQRGVIFYFVLSILPCSAPLGAIISALHLRAHRADIGRLPSIYGALTRLGIGVAVAQTTALIIILVLYQTTFGH